MTVMARALGRPDIADHGRAMYAADNLRHVQGPAI